MALTGALIVGAAGPVTRTGTRTMSGLKEINRAQHAMTARVNATKARAAEAPENTVEVPFTHDLGKAGIEVKNYTSINANGDNREWKFGTVSGYAACMPPNDESIDRNDDWLFTVPIHLTPGNYIVSFEVGIMGTSATGVEMDVALATEPTVEAATTVISPTTVYPDKDMTKYEHTCTVTEEGYYYLGFHCTTAKDMKGTLKLANVGMEASTLPVAPENTVEVPFTHDLGKAGTEVKNYTSINANGDNREWKFGTVSGYAACMPPNDESIDRNDDWLFTVPIHLTPGNYIVSYEVGIMGTGATGVEMDVALATEPTVEAATTVISPTTVYPDKDMTKYERNCSVTKEGYYYLGFHCTTAKDMKGTLKLANVGMRVGTSEPPVVVDPPAAGELTWTLAPKGELKATIRYTAPTLTKGGEPLTEISKVEITSRWGVDKFTYENVAPGEVITIDDVDMYQGINNRFTGVAYTGDVAGDMVEYKSIWCGPDTPLAPAHVHLAVNPDYTTATLSWDAVPATGEHGGYIDTESITYYVFDAFGSYYDPALFTTTDTSCTIDYSAMTEQDFYAYQVTAGYGENYSLDEASNIITAGTPDALPKRESFADGNYENMWLGNTAVDGYMQYGTLTDEYFASLFDPEDPDSPEPLTSQDGDGGFYFWLPMESGVSYGLISTRADISKATKPVLEFWYQGQGSIIEVYAGHEIGEMSAIASIDMKEAPTETWTQARIPLDAFKAAGAVMFEIRFVAAHNDDEHIWSVPVDNICVRNLDDNDVRIVTFDGASKAKPGDTVKFTAHVENLGTSAAAPVAVWTVNGKTVATDDIAEIAPNAFADVELAYTLPFNAPDTAEIALNIQLEGDATAADNEASASVTVTRASFATVNDLEATIDGSNVVLTWSHPTNEAAGPETVTEDFENDDYTPMSISGAGAWTVYDGDGVKTYNIFRELYNPFQTAPIAFQLFDNVVAQVPSTYADDAVAYSGQRYMLAPSAQSADNDNWLISPELSGNAQTVTFMAKSYTVTWPEALEIYYSTTDNAVTSFTAQVTDFTGLTADGIVPEVWTLFTVELPEGAKYFAIHHNTYDTLALFIDDVTYEAAPSMPEDLAIMGYHVFRNGEAVTAELHDSVLYTDVPLTSEHPAGEYEFNYTVVPVYNHGAVSESNVATVTMTHSGVENVSADTDAPSVWYNLQGVRVSESTLTPGIYIRVSGNRADKITVK